MIIRSVLGVLIKVQGCDGRVLVLVFVICITQSLSSFSSSSVGQMLEGVCTSDTLRHQMHQAFVWISITTTGFNVAVTYCQCYCNVYWINFSSHDMNTYPSRKSILICIIFSVNGTQYVISDVALLQL